MASISFTVPGPPVAWHRPLPSFRKGERRKHPADIEYQKRVGWLAAKARGARPVDNVGEWEVVRCEFYVADRRRRDVDNLEKNLLDGLTGVVFKDDSQVVAVGRKFKRYDKANPRTVVELRPTSGYMT